MKSAPTHRALHRLIALAILAGAVIIALFWFVEQAQIKNRAVESLSPLLESTLAKNDGSLEERVRPDISVLNLSDPGDALSPLDEALINHVKFSQPRAGEILHFSSGRIHAYYFVKNSQALGLSEEGDYLFYTDVSLATDVVRTTALIIAGVFVLVAAMLYIAGRATIRLLDRKDQSMRAFFANASHELKTPLMSMQSYAEGLAQGIVDKDTACAVIDRESTRMDHLIRGILAFSKLDGGMVQPTLSDCDAREVLYDCLQNIEAQAVRRGILLKPVLPNTLLIRSDETMLYSIFSNILTNSVRYAETEIRLEAAKGEKTLAIHLANDGPPISADDMAHIFDRFYKGSDGQTGLGLALALTYARLLSGNITVESTDDWTTFTVTLPLN